MIIDCHGHYTTVPAGVRVFRALQISNMGRPKDDRPDPGEPEMFTRQWVIWHLIEHDLHHGGEAFYTLGMNGLPTPDL